MTHLEPAMLAQQHTNNSVEEEVKSDELGLVDWSDKLKMMELKDVMDIDLHSIRNSAVN